MVRALIAALVVAACSRNHPLPTTLAIEHTAPRDATVVSLPRQLRIATFNVHFEPATKLLPGIRNDRELRDADVIVMEEVARDERSVDPWCSAACAIGRELGYHVRYAPGHAQRPGSHGVAILSRAPISDAEVIELPYFDVKFNSGRRIALTATVDIDGTPTTIYAVHLENRLTVADRRKQMIPILEHARTKTTPVIIAGDFNTSPMTWLAHVVPIPTGSQDDRLEELVRSYGFETPTADSGPTFRYLGMKLDGIYTRGFDTKRFGTTSASFVSDHSALWAVVRARN